MAGIDTEIRMTIKTLILKGMSRAGIARLLGLPESNVRYHARRVLAAAIDRRRLRNRKAARVAEAIQHWMGQRDDAVNLAALHHWLVAEHDYEGWLRSVQRYASAAA